MRLVNYFILLLLFFLPTKVVSQYQFKTLDSGNGLNCSQINCIYKDSRGYMWFGTPAGLYRYDGYTFKNFQCDSQDGTSLPDSYIKSIIESFIKSRPFAAYAFSAPLTIESIELLFFLS